MSAEEFCYWLKGYFELRDAGALSGHATLGPEQTKMIQEHLNLVFMNVTSQPPGPDSNSYCQTVRNMRPFIGPFTKLC